MPTAPANAAGIEIFYEDLGDPDGVPVLFVMGLGAQMVAWDDRFIARFTDTGHRAIRFDNRDVGLSTKTQSDVDFGTTFPTLAAGLPAEVPYLLSDMAADAASLLDHLGLESAHVVGASMGGMISQTLAIEHPERVRSLTSIMSTTGARDVGQPRPDMLAILVQPPATNREQAIVQAVESSRAISSPTMFDEDFARARAEQSYDRCFHPHGFALQLLAILASGSRDEALARLDVPTLVIHGDADPLVTPSGGERTAAVIPGAELLMFEGMGHDIPAPLHTPVADAIQAHIGRAEKS